MPKVLQSVPRGLQNGALAGHFDDFFCKKPTLHPTAYLLCFRHILEVLGPPVLKKFLLEMCVGSRSPKKPSLLHFFSSLGENVSKWPPKWGWEKVQKLIFFSLVPLWVPLGSFSLTFGLPGYHFGTFLGALGIILAPLGPTKMMPRQCKIQ